MLPFDADPALIEAAQVYEEARRVRRAIAADQQRSAAGEHGVAGERSAAGEHSAAHESRSQDRVEGDSDLGLLERDLADLLAQLNALLEDPELRRRADDALDERAAQLRIAVEAHLASERARATNQAAARIAQRAASSGRSMTEAEVLRVSDLMLDALGGGIEEFAGVDTSDRRDSVLATLSQIRLREARKQLRDGLLLTDQMNEIIAEALPSMLRGDPVLLVGETGGAKTALAEHLSHVGAGLEPELVSGYGDIPAAQLIGTHELRAQGGGTVSVFVDGPLLRAMIEGRPLILDEINAMPAEFLKRLNRILQLRPGDTFGVQENAGRHIEIAPGFAIIATANEQTPHRYRGLDRLSAELINRFGANTYRVHYPDAGLAYTDSPTENTLLATAAVVDRYGELPRELSSDEVVRVARAAFISQQIFAGSHGEGFGDFVSTEREIDGRPGLEESVLAPRTMVAILDKVAGSAGAITLDRALARFVEGIMHREDRHVLSLIVSGQGFDLSS